MPKRVDDSGDGAEARGRRRHLAAPLLLFLFAVLVRALPFHSVFLPTGVLFFGSDAYYHMRRILYSLARFPAVLDFDPYINFPEGARPIWTPFFDWGIAALMVPLRGNLTIGQLEAIAVWIPPLLGGGTVVALYCLARRHFGSAVALLAGAVLTVLSGHFWYSQLGFVDHHAAVALVTTLLLAAGMAFFDRLFRQPTGVGPGLESSLAMGLALASALLVWPGTLLHVGLVEAALLACLLSRSKRSDAVSLAGRMAVVHAMATCLLAPFTVGNTWAHWSSFSPVVLSNFQPWYFGAATGFSLACAWLWNRQHWTGESRLRRCVSAITIGVSIALLSLLLWPSLLTGLGEAWEWFAKEDAFQALVDESAPLFRLYDEFSIRIALARLSGFVFLAPLALVIAAGAVARGHNRAPAAFFLWWTLGVSTATVFQKRFFNSSSVPLALLFALSICWVYRTLPQHQVSTPWRRRLVKGLLASATLGLLIPTLMPYTPHLWNLYQATGGNHPPLRADLMQKFATVHLASWIRSNTKTTSGWLDASSRPEYGILASWGIGHILEYTGRRPTVSDNFGDDIGADNFQLAQRYYLTDERGASEILDRLGVRYVVAQYGSAFLSEEPGEGSMFAALYRFDGSEFKTTRAGADVWRPALRRHRLVYEWMPRAATVNGQSFYKLFEHVPGARIVGRAAPGAEIRLRLPVETIQKRQFLYAARTEAAHDGRYSLRVPYANSAGAGVVRPAEQYELRCEGERGFVNVSEEAVSRGADVPGPDLCLGGP